MQKPWIAPIPGTTKLQRLEKNLGAIALNLTEDDLAEINKGGVEDPNPGSKIARGRAQDDGDLRTSSDNGTNKRSRQHSLGPRPLTALRNVELIVLLMSTLTS